MTLPARPNLSTSPKAVQRYVADLERRLAEADALAARLADGIHGDEAAHAHFGRPVAFINPYDPKPTPVARLRESVAFIPDGNTRFHVRWVDDDGYLEVMAAHRRGSSAVTMEAQAANVIRLRGPR